MNDTIYNTYNVRADDIKMWRRHLHRNPELSFDEYGTAEFISSVLAKEGIEYRQIAETGVLARIECGGDLTRAVVLRADIDALPVDERTGLPFASLNRGVMHACGHDMHTAALLGVLSVINHNRALLSGTIFGLFQPGEEVCPGGAVAVLAETPFSGYDITAFLGQHTDPDLPTGTFGIRPGIYMASGDELRITVTGRGGHAAMPHTLKDPVPAAAAIITALQTINSRRTPPTVPTVLSIGKIVAEGATNIIPDSVYLEGTFRTFDESWRIKAKEIIGEIAGSIARAHGTEALVDITAGYPSVVNSRSIAARAVDRLTAVYGKGSVTEPELRPTAEDFGYYTHLYPSLFYRFGVGGPDPRNGCAGKLHSPQFNPDEDALRYAVCGMALLAGEFARTASR